MKRSIWIILSILFLFFAGFGAGWAQEEVNYKEILSTYKQEVKSAHSFSGTLYLQCQHTYIDVMQEGFPKLIENTFYLPVEDPIYQKVNPLFFKSYAQADLKAVVNGKKQTTTRKITSANTDLYASCPLVKNPSNEALKQCKSRDPLESQYVISLGKDNDSKPEVDLLIPADLYAWHYIPNLWYPDPVQLGFPEDITKVNIQRGNQVVAFMFTPTKFDPALMNLFRKNTLNPNLSPKDLKIILTINPKTNYCTALYIDAEIDKKRQMLFNIINSGATPTLAGFTTPSTTVMYSQAFQREDNGSLTVGLNYFASFSLTSFEWDK